MANVNLVNNLHISPVNTSSTQSSPHVAPAPSIKQTDSLTSMELTSSQRFSICSKIYKNLFAFFSCLFNCLCRYKMKSNVESPSHVAGNPKNSSVLEEKENSNEKTHTKPLEKLSSKDVVNSKEEIQINEEELEAVRPVKIKKIIKEPYIASSDLKYIGILGINYFFDYLIKSSTLNSWLEKDKKVSILFELKLEELDQVSEPIVICQNHPTEIENDTKMILDFTKELIEEDWQRELNNLNYLIENENPMGFKFSLCLSLTSNLEIPRSELIKNRFINVKDEQAVYSIIHLNNKDATYEEDVKKGVCFDKRFPVSAFYNVDPEKSD